MITLLTEGEYQIPDGCIIERTGNKFKVRHSLKRILGKNEYRCRDCVHRVWGYSKNSCYYRTHVCHMQPVTTEKATGVVRYKAVGEYNKICDRFVKRKEAKS